MAVIIKLKMIKVCDMCHEQYGEEMFKKINQYEHGKIEIKDVCTNKYVNSVNPTSGCSALLFEQTENRKVSNRVVINALVLPFRDLFPRNDEKTRGVPNAQ